MASRYQTITLDQIDSESVRESARLAVETFGATVCAYTDQHGQHVKVDDGEFTDLYQDGRLVAHLRTAAANSAR